MGVSRRDLEATVLVVDHVEEVSLQTNVILNGGVRGKRDNVSGLTERSQVARLSLEDGCLA